MLSHYYRDNPYSLRAAYILGFGLLTLWSAQTFIQTDNPITAMLALLVLGFCTGYIGRFLGRLLSPANSTLPRQVPPSADRPELLRAKKALLRRLEAYTSSHQAAVGIDPEATLQVVRNADQSYSCQLRHHDPKEKIFINYEYLIGASRKQPVMIKQSETMFAQTPGSDSVYLESD